MKKILAVIVVIILIIAAIFLIKNCQPRTKPAEEVDAEVDAEGVKETKEKKEELEEKTTQKNHQQNPTSPEADLTAYKNAFIDANVEFTCQIYKVPGFTEDEESMKEKLNDIYKYHGLPVDDNETMISILDAYENDLEVINTIKNNSSPCVYANN